MFISNARKKYPPPQRRILSLTLAAVLVCGCLSGGSAAKAYSGSAYTDNSLLGERLDSLFEEYPPNQSYFTSTPGGYDHSGNKWAPCNRVGYGDVTTGDMNRCGRFDGSYQCHAYAFYAQYRIFGKTQNHTVNPALEGAAAISYTTVKNPTKAQILNMPFGTHIKNTSPAHSIILLRCDENSITYIDCNCADGWGCAVHLHEADWQFFFSRNGIGSSVITGSAAYPTAETYPVPAEEGYGETPFTDIGTHWAKDYIQTAYQLSISSGISKTRFDPQGGMTRAMFVQMLYNIYHEGSSTYKSDFSDVSQSDWYYAAISWASTKGVVAGVGGQRFAPMQQVTRQEAMQILYNDHLSRTGTPPPDTGDEDSKPDGSKDPGTGESDSAVLGGVDLVAQAAGEEGETESDEDGDINSESSVGGGREDGQESGGAQEPGDKAPPGEQDPPSKPSADFTRYDDEKDIAVWAQAALAWAVEQGILTGRSETKLDPAGTMTRAESVTVLVKILEPDSTDH